MKLKKNKLPHIFDTYSIWLIYAIFTFLCGYVCFARLDVSLLQHWDETRHDVNTYEMPKSNNFIGNTYNYTKKYFNLKPP